MGSNSAYDTIIDQCLERLGKHLVIGLPLGLGKPNRLINAFYQRACRDRSIRLEFNTALSLDPPQADHWLEARVMAPILERLFGRDYPRLDYVVDLKAGRLPDNVTVSEFYFQSGDALGNSERQRHYVSSNYTHVARDLKARGVNLVLQLIAGPKDGHYSLSCNPDVTLDLAHLLVQDPEHQCMTVGQIHPGLPFMPGDAVVDADFFDVVVEEDPQQPLFGLPRGKVTLQDHAIGLHASRLVPDGGTLQIGIGSLSDALVHSLIFRQRRNADYRAMLAGVGASRTRIESRRPMEQGLYGASEMFMDGFMHLYQAGLLRRGVVDDLSAQQRRNAGQASSDDGVVMDAGFFLGSKGFYDFLNGLSEAERARFRMHGVGRINQLYGGDETLERAQRRRSRFINTCMKMTATGAAVSDGLADQQVVSGVGGQYNFVAMAHALQDSASILMLRSTRTSRGKVTSNIVWEYPHTTIPRHLRDLVVTEYGVADLRGKTDEECIQAMVGIMDARFQEDLVARAKKAGKLARNWQIPKTARTNTPERLRNTFERNRRDFPDFPFGCDLTDLERELVPALRKLKGLQKQRFKALQLLWQGRPEQHPKAMARLGLDKPTRLRERIMARLVAGVLSS
jgi:acyl-CoA hydrolase